MINSKQTKIVTTIGPASDSKEVFTQLIENGANIIRLNFSHGNHEEQGARIDMAREVANELNTSIGVLLDTKGPEIRTGMFKEDTQLTTGDKITITMDEVEGDASKFTVSYKELINDVKPGNSIMLDDGLIELKVLEIVGQDINCEIMNDGVIKSRKGVNVPGADLKFEFMSEKDRSDIIFGCEQGVDYVAASFVRNGKDVQEVRDLLNANGGERIQIISKIECQQAVAAIDEIIELSEGIMVARGDLGIEVPAEDVPSIQKDIISKCNKVGKPVITATQMLETMQKNPRPTRAEVSDVANAIFDGTDAVMLSGESAAGKYPVESVQMMAKIALNVEAEMKEKGSISELVDELETTNTAKTIALSVAQATRALNVEAVVAATTSGTTAKVISRFRPTAPIVAVCPNAEVANSLTIFKGVNPIVGLQDDTVDNVIKSSIKALKESGIDYEGKKVIVTGGIGAKKTNFMHIHSC